MGETTPDLLATLIQYFDPDTVSCTTMDRDALDTSNVHTSILFSPTYRPVLYPLSYSHSRLHVEEWMGWIDWNQV